MRDICIDGEKLRSLLARGSIKQKDVASEVGVTKHTVSRWCARGEHNIQQRHVEALACALGIAMDDLVARCSPDGDESGRQSLTAAEADWLAAYRKLSPLDQAKVRVEVERIIEQLNPS